MTEDWTNGVQRPKRYAEEQPPCNLAKDPARARELDQVLYSLAEGLRVVTVLVYPYVPEAAERLLAALGREPKDALSFEQASFGAVPGGAAILKLEPLFPKVEAVGTA